MSIKDPFTNLDIQTQSEGFYEGYSLLIALIPGVGRRTFGREGEKPEFGNFSWFSMMFGAGLGVGLMVFATAEPM